MKNIKDDTLYFTDNMEDVIERYEKLKDLGIIMNDKVDFTDHVTNVTKKTRHKMGWIIGSFHCRKTHFMKHMFKTLVIPHVDYCSQL